MTDSKPTIFYIYDALCGWCYGFSPVITEFYDNHKEEFNFRVLSGGMVTGEKVGPINKVAGYIKEAYTNVEEKTGIKFGQPFLNKLFEGGTDMFTSVPAGMALALFRTQQPENELAFATRMQHAIYYEGRPPAEWSTYGDCAAEFGLNGSDFALKMQNQKLLELTQQEFEVVSNWGIKGFPSVLLQKDDQAYLMSRGFSTLQELENILEKVEQEIGL